MNVAQRAIKGIIWAYAAFFGGRLVNLVTTAILAHLLVPEDFGLIGFTLLLLNFIDAVRALGINDALIYNSERVEDTADTAFLINLSLGVAQFVAVFFLAPLAVRFIDDPRIVNALRISALGFIFNALGETHSGLMEKELAFRRSFLPDIISTMIKGFFSILFAALGLGVWALIIGQLIGTASNTAAKWWVLKWRPRWRFYRDRARALWDYSFYVLAMTVIDVALEQADQMIIGTLLGSLQLGYYTIAAKIPEMIIANFSLVLAKVIFPSYTKMKDSREKLLQGYFATTRYTAYVTVPTGFGIAAVAPELIYVVFGNQWGPAIVLVQVLAFLGLVTSLPWSTGDVFKAIGRPDIPTKLRVVEALYTFPMIWFLAAAYKTAFVASFANLLAMIITVILRLYVVARFFELKPSVFIRLFRNPFIAGGVMFGAVTFWRVFASSFPFMRVACSSAQLDGSSLDIAQPFITCAPSTFAMLIVLLTSMIIGAVVYVIFLWLLEKEEILAARDLFLSIIRNRSKSNESDEENDSTDIALATSSVPENQSP